MSFGHEKNVKSKVFLKCLKVLHRQVFICLSLFLILFSLIPVLIFFFFQIILNFSRQVYQAYGPIKCFIVSLSLKCIGLTLATLFLKKAEFTRPQFTASVRQEPKILKVH